MFNSYDYYDFEDLRSSENLNKNKREPYVFTVTATNSSGTSSASSPTNDILPIVAPSAPTNVSGTNDDGKSIVSFNPGNNGGDSKVTYTVNTIPGALDPSAPSVPSVSGTSSPITVSGLKNGTFYTFTVTASNSAGTSPISSQSDKVYPAKQLSNLTITNATSNENGKTKVSYTTNAIDAGIYTVTVKAVQKSDNTKVFTSTGNSSPITINGLTNGVEYNVTASATSTSYPNVKINSNTVTIIPSTIPDMPSNLSSTSVSNGINISFKIPPNNGSNIQKYTLRPYYTTVDSTGKKSIKCDTSVTITDPAILNAASGSTGSYTFTTKDRTKTFDTTAFPPSTTTFPPCSAENYSYVPLKKNKKPNCCWFVFLLFIIICFFIFYYRNKKF